MTTHERCLKYYILSDLRNWILYAIFKQGPIIVDKWETCISDKLEDEIFTGDFEKELEVTAMEETKGNIQIWETHYNKRKIIVNWNDFPLHEVVGRH